MGVWTTWDMAEQRATELRGHEHGRHQPGMGSWLEPGRKAIGTGIQRWQGVSAWVGYRMIGLGCRMARPAVVARARSGM
jgi:hypothetical protein